MKPEERVRTIMPSATWITLGDLPGCRMPEWKRTAVITDDGTVYASAAIAGDEQAVWRCARHDGAVGIVNGSHVYLPAKWLARKYPDVAGIFQVIETLKERHIWPAPEGAERPDHGIAFSTARKS
jgi:hypothetical protein